MGKKHKKNKKHSHSHEPPGYFIPYQPGEMRVVLKLPTEPHPRVSYEEDLEVSPSPPDLHVSIPLATLRKHREHVVEGGDEAAGENRHHHHKHKKHKKKKHHGNLAPGESGMSQHSSQHSISSIQQDTPHHVTYRQHHNLPNIQGDTHMTLSQQQQQPSRKRHSSGDFLSTNTTQRASHRHHHYHDNNPPTRVSAHQDASPPTWVSAHQDASPPTWVSAHQDTSPPTWVSAHQDTSPPTWVSGHQEDNSPGTVTRLVPHTPPERHRDSKHHHHHHSPHKKHHKKHHEQEKEPQSLRFKIERGVQDPPQLQYQPHPSYPTPEGLAPPPLQDSLSSGHSHKHHKKKKKHKHSKSHESLPLTLKPAHPSAVIPYSHEQAPTVNTKLISSETGSATAGKSIGNQTGTASEDLAPSPKRSRTEQSYPYPYQAAKEPKTSQPAHHHQLQLKQEPSREEQEEKEENGDDEIEEALKVYHQPKSRPLAHNGKPRAFIQENKPRRLSQETKRPPAENTAPPKPHPPVIAALPKPEPVWPRVATPPERVWPRATTPPERVWPRAATPPERMWPRAAASPEREHQPKPPFSTLPAIGSQHTAPPPKQVVLSKSALRFFLKSLHHQIQRRDPQGIFAEPVTDDIAPGYSKIIHHPMDLSTMAAKVENNVYPSVNEFKDDFVLMCNNAMTYNAPDTLYYTEAKKLLTIGLKVIAKETSMRPDIRHGRVASAPRSATASPLPLPEFRLPPPTSTQLDYSSPCLCRIDLGLLRGHAQPRPVSAIPSPSAFLEQLRVDVTGLVDVSSQSHLTKVSVGVADEEGEDSGSEWAEEVLAQAQEAAEAAKENLHANRPGSRVCFLNRDKQGATTLSILNPDSMEEPSSKPVDLTALSERIRMGNNAATVLKSELPVCKATPISYLMYGPFGSFAPAYDSAFATLTKTDSDLLLSTYGNELGISYAHSLQQFVKGTGSFVSEMADAVLNGLTNSRHTKRLETQRAKQEREKQLQREASKGKEKSPQAQTEVPMGDEGTGRETIGENSLLRDDVMREVLDGKDVEEGGSVRGDISEGGSGEGVSETTSVQPEDAGSVSGEESSSMELENNQETSLTEAKQEDSIRLEASRVDQHLERSSALLSELQHHQMERLGDAPQKTAEGHVILPGPSEREVDTASKIAQELVALTAQVRPGDVVSVEALHHAMGIKVNPTERPHLLSEREDSGKNLPEGMLSEQD